MPPWRISWNWNCENFSELKFQFPVNYVKFFRTALMWTTDVCASTNYAVYRHISFRKETDLFANRPKNLKKLSVYGKFYHQEIRWKSFYFTRQNSLKSVQNSLKSAHFWKDFFFFFSTWVFFHEHSRIAGLQGKGEGISLTPHYHFHPLHRRLDISRAIAAESSPLRIASSRTRAGDLWFPSASR